MFGTFGLEAKQLGGRGIFTNIRLRRKIKNRYSKISNNWKGETLFTTIGLWCRMGLLWPGFQFIIYGNIQPGITLTKSQQSPALCFVFYRIEKIRY